MTDDIKGKRLHILNLFRLWYRECNSQFQIQAYKLDPPIVLFHGRCSGNLIENCLKHLALWENMFANQMFKRRQSLLPLWFQGLRRQLRDRSARDSEDAIKACGGGKVDILQEHLEVPLNSRGALAVTH